MQCMGHAGKQKYVTFIRLVFDVDEVFIQRLLDKIFAATNTSEELL